MVIKILSSEDRSKINMNDDSLFYSNSRFVYHLDSSFRNRLKKVYNNYLEEDKVILDLMSSWVSHLPSNKSYKKIIGHGMNKEELDSNKVLNEFWVQDLNINQKIPLRDREVDSILICAGWQYLQEPEIISSELRRIISKEGKLIISFSNRAFWDKTTKIWREGNYKTHFKYISDVLSVNGWNNIKIIEENNNFNYVLGFPIGSSDPFYCLICQPV